MYVLTSRFFSGKVMAPFYLPYDRLKYLAIAVCCYPLANTYLQEQRWKKIRQLQVFSSSSIRRNPVEDRYFSI